MTPPTIPLCYHLGQREGKAPHRRMLYILWVFRKHVLWNILVISCIWPSAFYPSSTPGCLSLERGGGETWGATSTLRRFYPTFLFPPPIPSSPPSHPGAWSCSRFPPIKRNHWCLSRGQSLLQCNDSNGCYAQMDVMHGRARGSDWGAAGGLRSHFPPHPGRGLLQAHWQAGQAGGPGTRPQG